MLAKKKAWRVLEEAEVQMIARLVLTECCHVLMSVSVLLRRLLS